MFITVEAVAHRLAKEMALISFEIMNLYIGTAVIRELMRALILMLKTQPRGVNIHFLLTPFFVENENRERMNMKTIADHADGHLYLLFSLYQKKAPVILLCEHISPWEIA